MILSNQNSLSSRLTALQASIDERPTVEQFCQYQTNQTRLTLDNINEMNSAAANYRLYLSLSSRDTSRRLAGLEGSVSNILLQQSMQESDLQNIADYLQNQAIARRLPQTTNHVHR